MSQRLLSPGVDINKNLASRVKPDHTLAPPCGLQVPRGPKNSSLLHHMPSLRTCSLTLLLNIIKGPCSKNQSGISQCGRNCDDFVATMILLLYVWKNIFV